MSDAMYEVTQIALHLRDTGIMESLGEAFGRGVSRAARAPELEAAIRRAAKYLRGGAPVQMAIDVLDAAIGDAR